MPVAIRLLHAAKDLAQYNQWVVSHPQGNLWQSGSWKSYQEALGRTVKIYSIEGKASALIVVDKTTGGFSVWSIPRGPLWTDKKTLDELMENIIADAKADKCMSIYLSPTLKLDAQDSKLKASPRHEQPRATRVIDLTQPDEKILSQMHPKGRYNIKVAEKHGVTVRKGSSEDIPAIYGLLKQTAKRDGFKILPESHYRRFVEDLEQSLLLIAEHQKKPISGLFGVQWKTTGIYYYGASSHEDRQLMAPYLLQWEAMKHFKAKGCDSYDLLGIAPEGSVHDAWAGISDFKRKFGGSVINYPAEQEIVLKPVIRGLLKLKRKIIG